MAEAGLGLNVLAEAPPVHRIEHPFDHVRREVAEEPPEITELSQFPCSQLHAGVLLPNACEKPHRMPFRISLVYPHRLQLAFPFTPHGLADARKLCCRAALRAPIRFVVYQGGEHTDTFTKVSVL